MSIAVVVNQARLAGDARRGRDAGTDRSSASPKSRRWSSSAAGFDETRGDVINVSAVEFIDGLDGVRNRRPGIMDKLAAASRHDDQRRLPSSSSLFWSPCSACGR